MNSPLANDIVAGLLDNTVAIRIPDNNNEALKFLEQLSEAAPGLTWNDGTLLTDYNPNRYGVLDGYYHMKSGGGLMWDSRRFIEESYPSIITFVNAEEVFDQTTDCSNILIDLL